MSKSGRAFIQTEELEGEIKRLKEKLGWEIAVRMAIHINEKHLYEQVAQLEAERERSKNIERFAKLVVKWEGPEGRLSNGRRCLYVDKENLFALAAALSELEETEWVMPE